MLSTIASLLGFGPAKGGESATLTPQLAAVMAAVRFPVFPLLVAPSPADIAAGPVVLRSVGTLDSKLVEPAGAGHLALVKARAAEAKARAEAAAGGAGGAKDGGAAARKAKEAKAKAAAAAAAALAAQEAADTDELSTDEKKRLLAAMGADDHYSMLGLGHLNINASDDQIKKAYRKLVLRYHPDKQQQEAGGTPKAAALNSADTDPVFLAIQKAYDCLSNEKSRRAYDSRYEFDETIPEGDEDLGEDNEDFFLVYGPVFERNARWSSKRPVPTLGGADESEDRVRAFYNFWFEFDSWRDFSGEGEHKLEDAEYREEKRWMERQNEKAAAKKKRVEVARLWDLVSRAYARDPRVIKMKKEEEAAKKAARDAKAAAKKAAEDVMKQKEEERLAKEKEEAERVKAEAASKKAQKEKEKRLLKRYRAELKRCAEASVALLLSGAGEGKKAKGASASAAAGASSCPFSTAEEASACVDFVCETVAASAAKETASAADTSSSTPSSVVAVVVSDVGALLRSFPAFPSNTPSTAAASGAGAAAPGDGGTPTVAAASGVFADAETPSGAVDAPTALAALQSLRKLESSLRDKTKAAVAEAQAAAEQAAKAAAAAKVTAAASRPEWTLQEAGVLAKAIAKFPPGTKNRWDCIATHVNGLNLGHSRTADECITKSRSMEAEKAKANSQSFSVFLASRGEHTNFVDKDAESRGSQAVSNLVTVVPGPNAAAVAAPAPAPAPAAAPAAKTAAATGSGAASAAAAAAAPGAVIVDASGWTPEQQSALEAALRTFPASMDKNERWKKIAEAVPGKSKSECVARFKEIREKVMQAKGGAAAAAGGKD